MYSLIKSILCLIIIFTCGLSSMAQKRHSPGRASKPDKDGYTALMRAAETGRLLTVRGLLKRAVNVNALDSFGRTALMMAAAQGHVKVVKVLLAADADPNLRAFNFHMGDYTALMAGMDSDSRNRLEMIDAMIAAGAELNPTDAGRTPLMRAIEK
jgi:ankyrin repeat protein